MLKTDFWMSPIVGEELKKDEKFLYIYLLTNHLTTQIGIYRILKKQIAIDMDISIEEVESLMASLIDRQLIRYNAETREVALRDWGIAIQSRGGKPVLDCIESELRKVVDTSLISFVLESIQKKDIRDLYEKFCDRNVMTYEDIDDTSTTCYTTCGQEKEKEKEKEKEQEKKQKAFNPSVENKPEEEVQSQMKKSSDVKEIIEFWDNNGFGFSNVNAKQQLLSWLDDSQFLRPKEVVLKALTIACSYNKRKLNYVVGILRNWENESLLTLEEIESYQDNKKSHSQNRQSPPSFQAGRDIPRDVNLDITAGEEE
ncbi:DNA replication protein DnaD [Bacillus sp. UMB0899]|nr:DNA replication protein DnaD [Bacillus sp. UMB0899]